MVLSDDTPIYRIFNIFDLITTIESKNLRFSCASNMNDKNELIGEYLILVNSKFGAITEISNKRLLMEQIESQSTQYMTCWTTSPDNIAIWSLYSPSQDGIMVKSTFGKLKEITDSFYKENNFAIAYSLQPNDERDLFFPPQIGSVKYINFRKYSTKLLK